MSLQIDITRAGEADGKVPGDVELRTWLGAALQDESENLELSLRIVGEAEGRELNRQYRERDYATNVLSFRAESLPEVRPQPLGDLVICAPVVAREATEQGKAVTAHWAHLCVHGTLHLLGYDHEVDADAREMEKREVEILARLGYQDPYRAGV